jgi:hypothetical protein
VIVDTKNLLYRTVTGKHKKHQDIGQTIILKRMLQNSGVPRNFFSGGGVQQIQLRTEDRQNGDLAAVAIWGR